jgi:hypothetical protein
LGAVVTVSTNGQICFGILFEEGFEFPWDVPDYDRDIDEWWLMKANGYKPSFELFNKEGEYLTKGKPAQDVIEKYFDERRKFIKDKPLPVALVNYCSVDYAEYILAVPSSRMHARRGYPVSFEPEALRVTVEDIAVLKKFCGDHGITYEGEPKWYLSSLWH